MLLRETIVFQKSSDECWIRKAGEKAYAFADLLSQKFVVPDDLDTEVFVVRTSQSQINGFVLVRERWARRELKNLRVDQATGPNEIPARLLIECASVLSRLLCRILRSIIAQRVWQQMSRFHGLAPLFKKGAVHKVSNYRSLPHDNSIESRRASIENPNRFVIRSRQYAW